MSIRASNKAAINWLWITALTVAVLSSSLARSAEQLYTDQPPVTPELAFSGPHTVGVTTITATDPKRLNTSTFITRIERPLVLEVWYPAAAAVTEKPDQILATYKDVTRLLKPFELQGQAYRDAPAVAEGKFPLILLSHGFTGYRTQMFYLAEHLASHGYIVVGIDHTDSTNADILDEAGRGPGIISTLYNRARDQQFLLDYFTDQQTAVATIVDTDNAAIIGHSMGGFGAINTIGGCYDFSSEGLQAFGIPMAVAMVMPFALNSCYGGREQADPRWKAVQLFAPWGGEYAVHNAEAMAKITVPTFYFAGDQDNTSGFEKGIKKLHQQTGSKENYLLVFENARHNIGPHPAPAVSFETDFELGHYFDPAWDTEIINRVVEHMSLAFLDCHVKADPDRCTYLPATESVQQYEGADHQFRDPWKGFKHLWGSGLRFYRQ
ncbi:acetylhydrolase [Porticoccaceae bacterium]|nr:acetylhydrolase [Porticoccaceae bacterium]MDC0004043.1 acetylhydrolase [Porticoccaceae bacterium]